MNINDIITFRVLCNTFNAIIGVILSNLSNNYSTLARNVAFESLKRLLRHPIWVEKKNMQLY